MKSITVVIALFLFLPLLGLMLPFMPTEFVGVTESLSLKNLQHLWDYLLIGYLGNTLILLFGVSAGVFVLGVGNAWIVVHYDFPGKKILEVALIAPLAIPTYVMAYLFVDLLQFSGPIQSSLRKVLEWDSLWFFPDPRSLFGAIWTFSFCLFPYVYLITRSQFLESSSRMMEAAKTLGMSQMKGFFKLGLPMARPAIFAGMALVMMEVLADYGAVSYFGVQTFSSGIFKAWLSFGDRLTAILLALGLFILVMVVFTIEQASRAKIRYSNNKKNPNIVRKIGFFETVLAMIFCGASLLFGFLLPILILVYLIYQDGVNIDHRFYGWLINSLSISSITALVSVTVALCLAYSVRFIPELKWVNRLLSFGYALPGAILGIGILSCLEFMNVGWWISSSVFVLIYAYLVRFLSSGLQTMEAGLYQITPTMDESAALLGLSKYQILKKLHLPLLWRSVTTAFIFIFVDVMKELPATLLLRPFNFDTLAVVIFQFAADERLSELAFPSITIVLIGILPVFILAKVIEREQKQFK